MGGAAFGPPPGLPPAVLSALPERQPLIETASSVKNSISAYL
jgi:hypothetical protein